MAVKLNSSENYEPIQIEITKEKYPICYNNKIEELVEQGAYPNKEEAEKQNHKFYIDCELYYQKHSGLFAVEEGAVESGTIYSPYDGELCKEYKEEIIGEVSIMSKFHEKFDKFDTSNVNVSNEDDVYSFAHDTFLKIAEEIENEINLDKDSIQLTSPIYYDHEKWYDEYHDEVVELYMRKILKNN